MCIVIAFSLFFKQHNTDRYIGPHSAIGQRNQKWTTQRMNSRENSETEWRRERERMKGKWKRIPERERDRGRERSGEIE